MKDKTVIFDTNTIRLKDEPRSVVMDSASKKLMEFYSHIVCQNGGVVLDVGFGMGFSADMMYKLSDHYHCIEINPQIYEKLAKWAKGKPNVTIWYGDWKELIPHFTQKFDGIFMDTHDDINYNDFEKYCVDIANENCILSIFNYLSLRDRNEMNEYLYELESNKFSKVVSPIHHVNWTYFKNGEFVKGDSKIKSKQTRII